MCVSVLFDVALFASLSHFMCLLTTCAVMFSFFYASLSLSAVRLSPLPRLALSPSCFPHETLTRNHVIRRAQPPRSGSVQYSRSDQPVSSAHFALCSDRHVLPGCCASFALFLRFVRLGEGCVFHISRPTHPQEPHPRRRESRKGHFLQSVDPREDN